MGRSCGSWRTPAALSGLARALRTRAMLSALASSDVASHSQRCAHPRARRCGSHRFRERRWSPRRPASGELTSIFLYFHGLGPCRPTSGVWGSVKTATASMGHKSPAGTVERVVESGRVSRKRNAVRFISTIPPRRTNTVHAGEDARSPRYSAHSCTPCVLCAHSDMSCGWTARSCLHMLARSGVW